MRLKIFKNFLTKDIGGNHMISGLWGMLLSILFVFVIIFCSEFLKSKMKWSNEATRKFIHVGVSHWWVFAMFFISEIQYALIPPILFIVLNYISYKKNVFTSMERRENKSDLGTVYFPISLLILIILTWNGGVLGGDFKYIGAIGILIMGYGDGFAAVVGKKCGSNKYKVYESTKSLEGSITMFVLSFTVTFIVLMLVRGYSFKVLAVSLIIAVLATLIEAVTPWGLDNITVPVLTAISTYYLMTYINSTEVLEILFRTIVGLLFNGIIAYSAFKARSLSKSGTIGAIILGTGIFVTSGIYGLTLLILFFMTSSFFSHFKKSRKKEVAKQFDKTGKRDVLQVLANGGIGLIFSILYFFTNEAIFLIALATSFAAANADTWSTELGVLNNRMPISLRTFKRVTKGTSGAISLIGTLSGLLGSAFIAISFVILIKIIKLKNLGVNTIEAFILITLGGFLGGIVDSFLGATVQGIYYSDEVGKETERKIYNGTPARLIRGFKFINNDLVNFISISIASFLSLGLLY